MNEKMRCVIMNRWTDEFAAYDRYIDHSTHDVAYIVTPDARATAEGCGAKFVVTVADFKDEAVVFAAMEECVGILGAVDRLICLSEYDLTLAARLREHYRIEGYRPEEVECFRDKTVMKSKVLAAGLRAPRFVTLDNEPATRAALYSLRYPLILKPRSGAASVGVSKIFSRAELDERLSKVSLSDYECEEFIDGPIVHVDGLISNGCLLFESASRYVGNCLAFAKGQPLGSIMLPAGERKELLLAFAGRCLQALKLLDGAFHMEIIEGTDGLFFLEVGARVGGAEIPFTTKEVHGIDLIESWVRQQVDSGYRVATTVHPVITSTSTSTGTTPKTNTEAELSGWLILPEPVGTRLITAKISKHIPSLYASVIPPNGHVFDGLGGYDRVLGRFRYRSHSESQIESDIHATIESFSYELDRIDGVAVA